MKYKVGDRVKLVEGDYREDIVEWMSSKKWIATIKEVVEDSDTYPTKYYLLEEDQALPCKWLPKYIENFADFINNRFEILDL